MKSTKIQTTRVGTTPKVSWLAVIAGIFHPSPVSNEEIDRAIDASREDSLKSQAILREIDASNKAALACLKEGGLGLETLHLSRPSP